VASALDLRAHAQLSATVADPGSNRAHDEFYSCFLVVLIGCFSPVKILAYALPAVVTAWLAFRAPLTISRNRIFAIGFIVILGALFYELVVAEFFLSSYLLAVVTYSAFLPIRSRRASCCGRCCSPRRT
jgi:hypothetical protein